VFDELRRMDWVPRSVHRKADGAAGHAELEQRKRRTPTPCGTGLGPENIAFGVPPPRGRNPSGQLRLSRCHRRPRRGRGSLPIRGLADPSQLDPLEGVARRETAEQLAELLNRLPAAQKKVLALYYYEDMRLREIAEVFGLTESRICQIHAQAILSLKAHLKNLNPSQN